jgi:hypothetical protein
MRYGRRVRDVRDNSIMVNLPDAAVLARYDHVEAKCVHFIERNRAVVRQGAAA